MASSRHDLHVSPAVQRRLVPDSDIGDLAAGRQEVLKGTQLRKGDFVKFGYTVHCPRCEDSEPLGWGNTSKAHGRICRERLGAELQKTPDGRRRMELHAKQEARWVLDGTVPADGGIDDVVRGDIPPENLPEAQREDYGWLDGPVEGLRKHLEAKKSPTPQAK